jgi:hypothetical protein
MQSSTKSTLVNMVPDAETSTNTLGTCTPIYSYIQIDTPSSALEKVVLCGKPSAVNVTSTRCECTHKENWDPAVCLELLSQFESVFDVPLIKCI